MRTQAELSTALVVCTMANSLTIFFQKFFKKKGTLS